MRHAPSESPDSPNMQRLASQIVLPFKGDFSAILTTEKGKVNLSKKMQGLLQSLYSFIEQTEYYNSYTRGVRPAHVALDADKAEKRYKEKMYELYYLARTYAVATTARHLGASKPMDTESILANAMKALSPGLMETIVQTLPHPLNFEADALSTNFVHLCMLPAVAQFDHQLIFEWMIHGGDLHKLAHRKDLILHIFKENAAVEDQFALPPAQTEQEHNERNRQLVALIMNMQYFGMYRSVEHFNKLFAYVTSETDRALENEAGRNVTAQIEKKHGKKMPDSGYIAQEIALQKLTWQRQLHDRYHDLMKIILEATSAGKTLPDVAYVEQEGDFSYEIELLQNLGRFNRTQGRSYSAPMLRIALDGASKEVEVWDQDEYLINIKTDPNAHVLQMDPLREMMPVLHLGQFSGIGAERMREPSLTIFDLARSYPGGLAWVDRVFLPALEILGELYLDAETFESTDSFVEELRPVSKTTVEAAPESQPTEIIVDALEEEDETEEEEVAEEAAPITGAPVALITLGRLMYDPLGGEVYYLRPTKGKVAASDRNRDLYHELTGEEVPKNMVLRQIPWEISSLTWGEVEAVLVRDFGIKAVKAEGSHMQFERSIPGMEKPLKATILRHAGQYPKKKTFRNVLQTLRIPKALFWIMVSKTQKKVVKNMESGDFDKFSQKIATSIKQQVEE